MFTTVNWKNGQSQHASQTNWSRQLNRLTRGTTSELDLTSHTKQLCRYSTWIGSMLCTHASNHSLHLLHTPHTTITQLLDWLIDWHFTRKQHACSKPLTWLRISHTHHIIKYISLLSTKAGKDNNWFWVHFPQGWKVVWLPKLTIPLCCDCGMWRYSKKQYNVSASFLPYDRRREWPFPLYGP